MAVRYTDDVADVDWKALKSVLAADRFDNGRSPEQLARSFANSFAVCFAWSAAEVVGTARVLSDGICNAYLVDAWTRSDFRRRGIARDMVNRLLDRLQGQHVYLQADDDNVAFYRHLGFSKQPQGMCRIVGKWLANSKG